MSHHETEFSLAELIDHPVLGLAVAEEGFDPRSLERILDAESGLGSHRTEREFFATAQFFATA
ncbi:MAG TPA: hypothetical protein VFQ82_05575 [Stellaceae bacterium]|nr:hypothetical protein [Stellaceae bacterium]